jgi:hypothetical protein
MGRLTKGLHMYSTPIAVLTLAFFLIPHVYSQSQPGHPSGDLVLTVRKSADPTRILPGSIWYFGDLLNSGETSQTLEAIQMPGGYAGSGKFFACGLEAWNAGRHRWLTLRSAKRSEYGQNPIVDVEIKPGEQVEVCGGLLPAQAGSVGQCVRFKLRTRWPPNISKTLVSEPFSIGEKEAPENGPCRASR